MKDFSRRGFQIASSSTEVKLAYTGFLVFAFVGYFTIALLGLLRIGPDYDSIVAHYRGSELEEMAFPRAFGQMLEETHFHAFIEGLILLVLTHLFVATSASTAMKSWVIVFAYGSTLGDLASPWLIKHAAPEFAAIQMGCWIVMLSTALPLMGVPFYEMWFKKEGRS